jgi:ribosomal protein L18E
MMYRSDVEHCWKNWIILLLLSVVANFQSSRSQNQIRITKTEEETKEGKVIVFRIKHHPEPDQIFAQKIVVSDEGIDKGLIRENSVGLLRQSQFNLPYTSEKQISSELITSVKVQWKEASFGNDPDERLIVPDRVTKSGSVLRSVKATKSDITQFSWKPLSEEAKKKISLEEAKKTTEEQLKTINKLLKR